MVSLPVHFEVIKTVASKFMSLVGESDVMPDEEGSSSSAYGSPKPTQRKTTQSPSVPMKSSSAAHARKSRKGPRSNASSEDLREVSEGQSAKIIQSVQLAIEARLEPGRDSAFRGSSVLDVEPTLLSALAPPGTDMSPLPGTPPAGSAAYHLAKSYVHLWWCLLDTQNTDPHPIVVMAAKALIFRVKMEVSITSMLIAVLTSGPGGQVTKEVLSEPNAPGDEGAGRRSEGKWMSGADYGGAAKETGRGTSHDIASSGRAGGSSFRAKQVTPPAFAHSQDGSRRPISAGFALDAVNGHFNDKMISEMALVSTVYEWNRKFFLRPDIGYEPVDDLLSPEGRERSNRCVPRWHSPHYLLPAKIASSAGCSCAMT